jgi:hypothetical protein
MPESVTFSFPSLPDVVITATRGQDGYDTRFITFSTDPGLLDENGDPVPPVELAGFLGP